MLTFGERLRKARERKGMTQTQVMKSTNITDKSLSRYETGASAPDPVTILTLIKLYDVSSDYIMGLSPKMGRSPGSEKEADDRKADVHELFDRLSEASQKKAEDYIIMLKTLEEVNSKNGLEE